ncbi:MAG: nucleotide-binding universal stress UspA family protein [Saprospiraceae bacterium]|jgi:nucleotide-binding universal stress UspA family protein|tara:strand:- start:276 stop:1100 length:825 start_codon:yes stop_codon:yes gene_type:complete
MKRILTLTDFSEIANHAIDAAMIFAKQHGADLKIYHVLKSTDHIMYELDADPQLFIRNRKNRINSTRLDGWRQKAIELGINVHFIIGAVDLVEGVLDLVNSQEVDLIVMGSTGIDESDGIWGTTTQKVIKEVDVPILVIKSKMRHHEFDNIVFASNLDLEDQAVFTSAMELIMPTSDAIIHFISVNTSSFFTQPSVLMTSALEEFEKLAKPYQSDSTFYNDYSVSAGISHYLEKEKPDVLIMSNRARNPLKEFFVPNAAIAAAGTVDCPVLILK